VRSTKRLGNASARNFAKYRVCGMVAVLDVLMKSDVVLPSEKAIMNVVKSAIDIDLLKSWDKYSPSAITRAGVVQGRK
jgi:hypothetical protein